MRVPLSLLLLAATLCLHGATINVINHDSPGEGLNDPTPALPVGGNTGTTVGQQRLIVMQRAAALWGTRIVSAVTIQVGAEFNPLTCSESSAVLGSAGPRSVIRDFAGAPVPGTYYAMALANALAGTDLDPQNVDVEAEFNSNLGKPGCLSSVQWYYGLDGNAPAGTIDFLDVVLHEYAHGLGFLSTVNLSTGARLNGFNDAYILHLEDHSTGKLYPEMTDAERLAASTAGGNLHWVGTNTVSASDHLATGRDINGHVLMYAPNPTEPGSSVSHFDVSLFPNELMEPFANAVTDRRLTQELFRDIGWVVLPPFQTNGQALLTETCVNGGIDPGETVTVDLTLRNMGLADVGSLTATLLSTNGVTNPDGPQIYGAMTVLGAAVTRPFTFTADAQCGDVIRPTLRLQDGLTDYGTVSFAFRIGTTHQYTNSNALSIPNAGTATPYPSTITISNHAGVLRGLEVRLVGLNHGNPDDVDILLVGPQGQKVLIMSDAGGSLDVTSATLTFSDNASSSLPDSGQITSGTYRPTNYGVGDTFSSPAPSGPYAGSLSVFNGTDPNGTWQLFIIDDGVPASGSLSGWALILPECCALSTNHPPALTFSNSTINYIENAAPTTVAADAEVTDDDSPSFQGGSLTVAITTSGTAADQLGIRNDGNGPGEIGLSANTVTFGGTILGNYTGGTNGSSLVVNFTSTNATAAAVQALCRVVTFFNLSDAPSTNARTVRFTVTDGSSGSAVASKIVAVTAINDAPVISAVTERFILEDVSTGPIPFVIGDADTAAGALAISATSSNVVLLPPANIVFGGAGSNRTVTIQPASNQFGITLVTLLVTDGAQTNSTSFLLTVAPVNDVPAISSIANQAIPEDTATPELGILVGDVETPAGLLVISATSSNLALVPSGNIVLGGSNSNRTAIIRPATNQFGTTLIKLFVTDGESTNSSSFVVTVSPVNDPPTISSVPDQSITEDGNTGPVSFTIGDVDTAANTLIVSAASSNLTLVPLSNVVFGGSGSNRTATIAAAPNQIGTSLITLFVMDGQATNSTSFLLSVTGVNDAPTISAVADRSTPEDRISDPIPFSVSDLETPPGALIVSAASSNALLVPITNIFFAGSDSNRTVTIQPATNQFGTTLITVFVTDGELTNSTSFLLTVTPINDSPLISSVPDQFIVEDTATAALSFVIDDVDTPASALTVTATSSNLALVSQASLLLSGSDSNRTMTIFPVTNAVGTTLITLFVTDGQTTNRTSFLVTVSPENDPPFIAVVPDQITPEDTAIGINLVIGDVDTAAGALLVSATSSNLALLPATNIVLSGFASNRIASFIPATNESGTTLITLYVSDGEATNTSSFLLTVTAVNDPPALSEVPDVTIPEDGSAGPIELVVSDVETAANLLVLTASSSNPVLVPTANITVSGLASNRAATILPATNQSGTTVITLFVTDGQATNSEAFLLTVAPVNDGPVISAVADQAGTEDTAVGPIHFSVSDVDHPPGALVTWAASSNPALVSPTNIVFAGSDTNRSVTFLPETNQFGSALITLLVTDGAITNSSSFLLSIAGVNDPPAISSIADRTVAEDTSIGPILLEIGDVETAADELTLAAAVSNTALIPLTNIVFSGSASNRSVTISPATNQVGTSVITLLVGDGQVTNSTTFTLTVTAVSDGPVISGVGDTVIFEDHSSVILFTVGDSDSALEALTVWAASSNTSLLPATNILLSGTSSNRSATIYPATNEFGTTLVTFFVTDGSATNSTSFLFTVEPVNDPPTVDALTNVTVAANSGEFVIPFTGLTAGPTNEQQALSVAASVSDPALLGAPLVIYQSGEPGGSLTLTPLNAAGTSVVSIVVTDTGGTVNGGIEATTNTFTVTLLPIADLAALNAARFEGTNMLVTVTVTNLGPHTAHAVSVTNHLPDGSTILSVVSDAASCVTSNDTVICSFLSLPAGTSGLASLTLAVEPRSLFTNVSLVGSSDIDSNPGNNVATTIIAMGGAQDFDADGMPDWWELAHGLDPRVPDASSDPDFDALTNLEEFIAGTNPHDAASVLRITRIVLENGTDTVVLSFLAVSNRTYSILGSPHPSGSWTNVAQVTAAQSGIITVTNSGNAMPARFYRVVTPQ